MQKEGLIEEIKTDYYKHEMTKNLPLKESDLTLLSARELVFINSELEKHSGKIAAELSAFSHEDIPEVGAKEEEVLDYEAVFYRTPETSVRAYSKEDD